MRRKFTKRDDPPGITGTPGWADAKVRGMGCRWTISKESKLGLLNALMINWKSPAFKPVARKALREIRDALRRYPGRVELTRQEEAEAGGRHRPKRKAIWACCVALARVWTKFALDPSEDESKARSQRARFVFEALEGLGVEYSCAGVEKFLRQIPADFR